MESIVLASASATRRRLLRAADVAFRVVATDIDERALEAALISEGRDAREIALALAREKARSVSRLHPNDFVIGADQTLACDGTRFHKPENIVAAATQLRALAGKSHALFSAVSVHRDGVVQFDAVEEARMTMRPLSERFLDAYLEAHGAEIVGSVGAYQIEGAGVQLFEAIEGDTFVIMGLPLLPLLAYLRTAGLILA